MKKGIHPEMKLITVKCACGAEHQMYSTEDNFRVDVCSKCHPFFLGETSSQIIDTEGRVQKFKNKYSKFLNS
ncbi:50S ribosomal protein L31 [Marinitoga litoralis]|jgi:large subunit ribosomal protein L31|uniref:50S ribosomal protein L31 n=1 Tax=Marinitoga litoralis TaxID=570855 RepID=UPI00195F774A|nr:50S ribosomal protein L31 [Marinitoga litoralis]